MVWCERDVPKLDRYVLEARFSFGTSTRICNKSLETNLQFANCNAVTNRTIYNDSRPTIATAKLCDHISNKVSTEGTSATNHQNPP